MAEEKAESVSSEKLEIEDEDESDLEDEVSDNGRWKKIKEEVETSRQLVPVKTWHAFDTERGLRVAWNETEFQFKNIKRIKRSFDSLLKMKEHPNIVKLYDYWVKEIEPIDSAVKEEKSKEDKAKTLMKLVFITEIITAGTLRKYLKDETPSNRPVNHRVIFRWCTQIVSALGHIHKADQSHGRIRPTTIFIQHNGQIKLSLVGVDDILYSLNKSGKKSKEEQAFIYFSPEMIENNMAKSSAADIYALGITCLEMCKVSKPFSECASDVDMIQKKKDHMLPDCLELVKDAKFRDFITCCLKPIEERATARRLVFHPYLFRVPTLRVLAAHSVLRQEMNYKEAKDEDAFETFQEACGESISTWVEKVAKPGFVKMYNPKTNSKIKIKPPPDKSWPSAPQKCLEDVRLGFFPLSVIKAKRSPAVAKQKNKSNDSPEERRVQAETTSVTVTPKIDPDNGIASRTDKLPEAATFSVRYKLHGLSRNSTNPSASGPATHSGSDSGLTTPIQPPTPGPDQISLPELDMSAFTSKLDRNGVQSSSKTVDGDGEIEKRTPAIHSAEESRRSSRHGKYTQKSLWRSLTFDLELKPNVEKVASDLMVKHGLLNSLDAREMSDVIAKALKDASLLPPPKKKKPASTKGTTTPTQQEAQQELDASSRPKSQTPSQIQTPVAAQSQTPQPPPRQINQTPPHVQTPIPIQGQVHHQAHASLLNMSNASPINHVHPSPPTMSGFVGPNGTVYSIVPRGVRQSLPDQLSYQLMVGHPFVVAPSSNQGRGVRRRISQTTPTNPHDRQPQQQPQQQEHQQSNARESII